jgi:hypothetical protein
MMAGLRGGRHRVPSGVESRHGHRRPSPWGSAQAPGLNAEVGGQWPSSVRLCRARSEVTVRPFGESA